MKFQLGRLRITLEVIKPHVPKGPPSNFELSQSSELNRLFPDEPVPTSPHDTVWKHKGSFESLKDRHR